MCEKLCSLLHQVMLSSVMGPMYAYIDIKKELTWAQLLTCFERKMYLSLLGRSTWLQKVATLYDNVSLCWSKWMPLRDEVSHLLGRVGERIHHKNVFYPKKGTHSSIPRIHMYFQPLPSLHLHPFHFYLHSWCLNLHFLKLVTWNWTVATAGHAQSNGLLVYLFSR